ncbi:MAG: type II secretion system F family protein [Lachnospiraceae bacterium]|nr:type II secretion system F family protein [Lachnospiraceae bacterium]
MEYVKGLALWIYSRLERQKRKNKKNSLFWQSNTVREDLKILYPMQDIAKKQKEFVIEKLSLGILILLVGGVIGILLMIQERRVDYVENNQLPRSEYGEGSQIIALIAENGIEEAQLTLELAERQYTKQELIELYDFFQPELETVVLGENRSFDEVSYDLNLVSGLEGYPFEILWYTDEEYVESNGRLIQNELSEAVVVELTAQISCQEFEREENFWCCIQSRASPLSMQEQLQRQLQDLEARNREQEYIMLPTEYGGKEIVWTRQTQKNGFLFLIATPLVCIVLLFSKDKDLHKRVEEREEQMKMDYPELVSKLALLLGAGMTVPNAWQRIVTDYCKKDLPETKKRYAYEEMLLTANELKNGVFQQEALEGFGRRCRIPCYNKLATLLTQNVRSGSANLALLLQEEATEAFEERKHMARRQGERAGTKLLVPMMLLLTIVMIIVIVPTFLSNM